MAIDQFRQILRRMAVKSNEKEKYSSKKDTNVKVISGITDIS